MHSNYSTHHVNVRHYLGDRSHGWVSLILYLEIHQPILCFVSFFYNLGQLVCIVRHLLSNANRVH